MKIESINLLPPPFTLLGILFTGLKLTGHIDWPWIRVTAPFWGPAAFYAVLALCIIGWFTVRNLMSMRREAAKRKRN